MNSSMQAEWECTKVIHSYAAAADGDDAEAFVRLFTPDGLWERPDGSVQRGHEQIRAAYAARPRSGFSRHIVAGVLVNVLELRRARASSLAIVLRAPGSHELPLRKVPGIHIVTYEDQLLCSEEGSWQIAHRTGKVLMTMDGSTS